MPFIEVNNVTYYYEDTGKGDKTIVFAHGLLWSCRMFDDQIHYFKDNYRVIAFDFRGQGKTAISKDGYDFETLTSDVISLLDAINVNNVHFAGLSMGGMIGMRLASRFPEKFRSLIVLETSPDAESPEAIKKYNKLNFVAKWFGLRLVAGSVMKIMFSKSFLEDKANKKKKQYWKKQLLSNRRRGITKAVNGVIGREDFSSELQNISCPTLIIVGEEDIATPPQHAEKIKESINGSTLVYIPKAGHSSTIEQPDLVNKTIENFLNNIS